MKRRGKSGGLYVFMLAALAAGILLTLCLPSAVTLGILAVLVIALLCICLIR